MEAERMRLYKEIGARIKALRLEKGYTRESMAAHIKLSGKFLYEIEFGRKGFSVDVLLRIGNWLWLYYDRKGIHHKRKRYE